MIPTLRTTARLLAVTFGVAAIGCGGSTPTLSSLAITPATASVAIGHTATLAVAGTNSDGSAQAITDAVWTSSTPAIATVTQAGVVTGAVRTSSTPAIATVTQAGVVTGTAAGVATITAASSGLTATATVTVTAAALTSLSVAPATATLAVGATQALVVTGNYDDGSHATLTSSAAFTTSSPATATVSSAGLITAVAAGSATITATFSGKSATVAVTVTASTVTLSSIASSPATVTLAAAATQQLTITGTYSDNSHADVTASAAFVSDTTSVATVSTGGLVTAVAAGSATITVSLSGKTTTVAVTVTGAAATLVSIAVTPNPVIIPTVSGTGQLVVTGTFSSGPTQDLTASAAFTSLDVTIATVSSAGLVTGVKSGTTSISVSVTPTGGTAVTSSTAVNVAIANTSPAVVFDGQYGAGVQFMDFGGAVNSVTIDAATTNSQTGHASLKLVLAPSGSYTGGAFVDARLNGARNLSAYDCVTFWAKASAALTLDLVGLGNDAGPASARNGYETERHGIALTTSWVQFVVPIPNPALLTSNDGLFHFADGTNHTGTVWLADIKYELRGLAKGVPSWNNTTAVLPGLTDQVQSSDLAIHYASADATPFDLTATNLHYFSFSSDNAAVTVSSAGLITLGAASDSANITATVAGVNSSNTLHVSQATVVLPSPTTLPPTPSVPSGAKVISLYSSAPGGFNGTASDFGQNVDHWLTSWSGGSGGNTFSVTVGAQTANPRKYVLGTGAASFVGVDFIGTSGAHELDVSAMTRFHFDLWTPDDGANFQLQLVDGGADKLVATQKTLGQATLTPGSTPALATGQWLSYDLSLATAFPDGAPHWVSPPANLKQMAQLLFLIPGNAPGATFYVDNIYFHDDGGSSGGGTAPTTLATAPTAAAANVISLFSSKYTGGTAGGDYSGKVDSYNASCFGPPGNTVADYTITGTSHVVKQYTMAANSFGVVETIGATGGTAVPPDSAICNGGTQSGVDEIDITGMTAVHFDVWSPGGSANFQVQVVGADGTGLIAGPGAPGANPGTTFSTPANTVAAGVWVPIDLAFSTFGPPGAPAGLNKLGLTKFFSTIGGTFFIDNLYFYKAAAGGGGGTPPTAPAPAPAAAPGNVIWLFNTSGTYTAGNSTQDAVSTWSTGWSGYGTAGGFSTYPIPGSSSTVNLYSVLRYAGVDFATINATSTGMTHFHADVWSPSAAAQFGIKLGLGGGTQFIVPAALTANTWTSVDIALSAFTGIDQTNINEFLFVDNITSNEDGTFYIDNVYFYK